MAHGNDPWYFTVHGICPWFLSHSHLGFFSCFIEWGYVTINAQLPCIYEGRNNDFLDQFMSNLIMKVKMDGIMVGL